MLTAEQVGLSAVLDRPDLIAMVVCSLYASAARQRAATLDLLGGLCVISPDEGLQYVLDGFSDARPVYRETFRFQWLIHGLRRAPTDHSFSEEEDRWRVAVVTFCNALCGSVENGDERMALRDELRRRGLDDALQVR